MLLLCIREIQEPLLNQLETCCEQLVFAKATAVLQRGQKTVRIVKVSDCQEAMSGKGYGPALDIEHSLVDFFSKSGSLLVLARL